MGPVEDQHVSMIAVFFKHVLMQLTNHFTLSESTECTLFSVFYSWYICNSLLGVAAIFSPIYIYSELTIKYLSHCDFVHTFLPALSIFIYFKKIGAVIFVLLISIYNMKLILTSTEFCV